MQVGETIVGGTEIHSSNDPGNISRLHDAVARGVGICL